MTKLSKKFMSLAIASFVTVSSVFGGNVDTAKAATTTTTTTYAGMKDTTYTVHFKMPSDWKTSETPRVYSYHKIDDGVNEGEKEDDPIFRDVWPGTKMTRDADGWYTATINSKILTGASTSLGTVKTYVIFTNGISEKTDANGKVLTYVDPIDKKTYPEYNVEYRTPAETAVEGDDEAYSISSDVWFDAGTMTVPSTSNPNTTATVTPSKTPTATPTSTPTVAPATSTPTTAPTATPTNIPVVVPTVEPVTGPQVSANVESKDVVNGNYFYEEDNDYINVKVNLADGATSATYSIDNGPEKTITQPTTVKVGEGKIANSAITLTVKSTDGKTTNTQNFTYFKATKVEAPKKLSTAMFKLFSTVSSLANSTEVADTTTRIIPVHFSAPAKWKSTDTVYAYAYYDIKTGANGVESTGKLLGDWPGTPVTKDANGYYSINITASTSKIRVIFSSVEGELGELNKSETIAGDNNYTCKVVGKLPCVVDEKGVPNYDAPKDGYELSQESWIISSSETEADVTTVNPNPTAAPTATPTAKPTATPTTAPTATPTVAPTFAAYFGAEKSAPQYNTTKQTISAVAVNATGKVTYSFAVDGKVIYQGENNSTTWDASGLEAGSHTLTAVITDEKTKKNVGLVKTYELEKAAPTATAVATVTPSAIPTVVPTVVPTATAIATVTPSAIPTVTPTAIPTVTPTAIPTATPTAIPTIEPTAVVVPTPEVPNNNPVTTPAALSGSISFSKTGKTAGETITIKAKGKNGTPKYKYTYYVVKGSKKKTLAKNTTKTSVQWTPTAAGKYTIKVKITDAAKKTKTIKKTYTVKARVITIKSFKTSKKSGQKAKTKITLTAKATTKKGKVSYKFAVQKGSGKIKTIKGYSSKNKKVWKPTKKGTYKLYVYVKNGKGVVVAKTKKFVVK